MICKNCDSVIEDNATVCPYCLTPVNAGGKGNGGGWQDPDPIGGGTGSNAKSPNLAIGIITGILGLAFLVEAFLYFVVLAP